VRAFVHVASATRTWKAAVVKEDPSQDQSDRQDAEDVDRGELERCGAHEPGREPDTPSNPMTTAMLDPSGEVRVRGSLAIRRVHILSLCNENRILGKELHEEALSIATDLPARALYRVVERVRRLT
jgi:hypothetical protein